MVAAGIEPGDRVAIWAPNCVEWIAAALGAVGAGGVLVPINTRFKGREAAYVLGRSRARMLFTVRGFLDLDFPAMLGDAADLPALETVVLLKGEGGARLGGVPGRRPRGRTGSAAEQRAGAVKAEDLSDIIFTSGTTGRPKGVMCTHGQTLRVFEVWSRVVGLRRGRPVPGRQPVLPHVRLQGRLPVRDHAGGHDRSPMRCSTPARCSSGSTRSG